MTIALLPLVFGWMALHSPVTPPVRTGPAELYVINAVSEADIVQKARRSWNVTTDLLGESDKIRFVFASTPTPADPGGNATAKADDQKPAGSFPMTAPLYYASSDLFRLILDFGVPQPEDPLRIADAVKLAGYKATKGHHPRAVLLVLAGNDRDESQDDAATVRHLLAVLKVPLYVWSLGEVKPGSTAAAWGAEEIGQTWRLAAAAGRLRKGLVGQRTPKVAAAAQRSPQPAGADR
jgi:hypothetical protein